MEVEVHQEFDNEVDEATRKDVLERDNYSCVVCGTPTEEVHHIDAKGMGGTENSVIEGLWNKATVCRLHHDRAHAEEIDLLFVEGDDSRVLTIAGYEGRIYWNEMPEKKAEKAEVFYEKMGQLIVSIQRNFWKLSGILKTFKNDHLHEGLGYDTFREFMQSPDIPIGYDTGQKLIRVRKRMEKALKRGQLHVDDVIEMGLEKADRISRYAGRENFPDWVRLAKQLNQHDLRKEIKESESGESQSLSEASESRSGDFGDEPGSPQGGNAQNVELPQDSGGSAEGSNVGDLQRAKELLQNVQQNPNDIDSMREAYYIVRDKYAEMGGL